MFWPKITKSIVERRHIGVSWIDILKEKRGVKMAGKRVYRPRKRPAWERKEYSHDAKKAVREYREDVNKYLFAKRR